MQRAAGNEKIEVFAYRDLQTQIFDGRTLVQFADFKSDRFVSLDFFDAVLVRAMPMGSLEQVIFRVNALHAAVSNGQAVFNSPRTLEIAIDKWLTLDLLARAGLTVPRTAVCQSRAQAMQLFETWNCPVVVKPVFGGEGRGLMQIDCTDLAWRIFGSLEVNQSVIYMQEYAEHVGYDLRLLRIGDECFSIARHNQTDWRTNLTRGGHAKPHQATATQLDIANRAAAAIGASMLGIDLLPTKDGRLLLLEVNAVPGWKGLANCLDVDIAEKIFNHMRRTTATAVHGCAE